MSAPNALKVSAISGLDLLAEIRAERFVHRRKGPDAIMVPLWFHYGDKQMATLTLKNIPDDLHEVLKTSAQRNRRSLNSEILARLEAGPEAHSAEVHAKGLREFTRTLPRLDHRKIAAFKRRGRA